ncbi:MAG: hypothetical protein LBS03_00840 [Bacteroidales bacterium]|jgi:hypothetical protein|nr:hypothetical protein [Bacteroidales bacterium]
MIIDTKEEASTLWRTKTLFVALFLVAILCVVFIVDLETQWKTMVAGGLALVFLFFYWFQYRMEYTYFYFSNNGKNLLFRFYSLRNLYGKPQSIEIAKLNFYKYDIVSAFFNKKEYLLLYQKTPRGIAKYPPISLTLLTKKQKTELKRALFVSSKTADKA